MTWIAENWYILIAILVVIIIGAVSVYTFLCYPTEKRKQKIKEWLLYAVTIAEKELGGGTGKIKLRTVYDMFITKFPFISRMLSFEKFSILVDEALVDMRAMLVTNAAAKEFVSSK